MPFIFLGLIDEFGVSVEQIAVPRRHRGLLRGHGPAELRRPDPGRVAPTAARVSAGSCSAAGFAAQALASSFLTFAVPIVASRIGSSPQHPVGNGLLAEQFPTERRGFAISAHIAGGNVGTVVVALIGVPLIAAVGWRGASVVFGCRRSSIAVLILMFVRERGHRPRRRACRGHASGPRCGSVLARPRPALALPHLGARRRRARARRRQPVRAHLHDPGPRPVRSDCRADVRRADRLLGPDAARRRLAVGPDRPQATDHRRLPRRRGRVPRLPGGRDEPGGAVARDRTDGSVLASPRARSSRRFSATSHRRPPATPRTPSTSRWPSASGRSGRSSTAYVIGALGEAAGLPVVFGLMAVTFILAALGTLPIHAEQRARENAAFEATLR